MFIEHSQEINVLNGALLSGALWLRFRGGNEVRHGSEMMQMLADAFDFLLKL